MTAENSAQNQRGRPFPKGRSGNPQGKPKGARHRLTVLAEQLLEADAEAVINRIIKKAKAGDMTAARLVLERLVPPSRGRRLELGLPKISDAATSLQAAGAIVDRMATGEIAPDEAAAAMGVIDQYRKASELVELEKRIAALEAVQVKS